MEGEEMIETGAAESSRADERLPGITVAALASLGAGAIHAAATGIHAEHLQLARLFVAVSVFQLGWGLWALVRPARWLAWVGAIGNAVIVGGWLLTRVSGISFIDGLEVAEDPQLADTVCAALGLVAVGGALAAGLVGRRRAPAPHLWAPALLIAAVTIPAMISGSTHVHDHDESATHSHDESATGVDGELTAADDGHTHDETATDGATDTTAHSHDESTDGSADATTWPRPYDPAQPLDLSGVPGVTAEQEARATALIEATQRELPAFSDPAVAESLGYRSIGDGRTGFEHYINVSLINDDDRLLDPTAPESLVYQVEGDSKTLVSAMFIATTGTAIDDPELVDFAGPLMQWHVHGNLCWSRNAQGTPVVVGVTDDTGSCPTGSVNAGGDNPMVHVWIAPHECGPFAALEGEGAGQAAVDDELRSDRCHDHSHADEAASDDTSPQPYDPTQPIDLSGMAGVSAEQQARAENLIAVTLADLPRYADPAAAEAAGYRTIGDGSTGYEHYVNWSLINDGRVLDSDYPESLVYTTQGGKKTLAAAMYMLPDGETLDTVPDVGGALTQWHIHNNLCFSNDPAETGETRVVGLTAADGTCRFGVKLEENPMLHVWIVPHQCGPFAALEGVGGGQIKEGEERLCDHAHGSG
jgi:hypothetical protein